MRIQAALVMLALFVPMSAYATECTSNLDCPDGEACEWSGSCPPCAGGSGGAGGVDCPPCTETGTCAAATGILIVGPACAVDADCPMAFACISVEVGATACGDCTCECDPTGGECPPCECPPCEPTSATTENRCVFVPATCTDDSACADGFTCAVEQMCEGSGCACPECDPASGVECPPCDCPPPTDPVCHVTGGWCLPPIDVPCASDATCGSGWTCEAVGMGGGCDCACAPCEAGVECPPCDCGGGCSGSAPDSVCLPPGWGAVLDELTVVGGDDAGGGGGSSEAAFDFPGGTPAPTNGRSGDEPSGGGSSSSNDDSSGCSSAQGAPAFGALALALALLLRRRRS